MKRIIELDVKPTIKELAVAFCDLSSEEITAFFNEVAQEGASRLKDIRWLYMFALNEDNLSAEGKKLIATIADEFNEQRIKKAAQHG